MLRLSSNTFNYQSLRLISGRTKLVFALLLGLSASVLAAGLLLRSRRRRYRAVSTGLQRLNTFETSDSRDGDSRESSFNHAPNHVQSHTPFYSPTSDGATSTSREESSIVAVKPSPGASYIAPTSCNALVGDHHKLEIEAEQVEEEVDTVLSRRESASSEDSFFSANEEATENQLYISSRKLVQKKEVMCRKNRAVLLCCETEDDFLAKLYCVRKAFDVLVQNQTHRYYFLETTRNIMTSILQSTNQDPSLFLQRFQGLVNFLQDDRGWEITEKELMSRKVVCMNVYDVVLDFILLDAFDELKDPPTTLLNVLRNRWLSESLKVSGISTVIWGVSMAKKGLLKNKMGFMHHFYSLSETISPTLAWGFMGTNTSLTEKCLRFKTAINEFTRTIFSLEKMHYSSVEALSDDILYHAQQAAQSLQT